MLKANKIKKAFMIVKYSNHSYTARFVVGRNIRLSSTPLRVGHGNPIQERTRMDDRNHQPLQIQLYHITIEALMINNTCKRHKSVCVGVRKWEKENSDIAAHIENITSQRNVTTIKAKFPQRRNFLQIYIPTCDDPSDTY